MFPHADTIYTINTLDYPQQLRHAANQRLAASIDTGGHSRVGVGWLAGVLTRLRGASQEWMARPLPTGSAKPAHRAS
jgi:hypothetical protein